MSFVSFNKMLVNKHCKFERFAVGIFALFAAFAVVVGFCINADVQQNRHILSNQAMYSTEFAMSKTKAKGNVLNVYASKDHTKAFLLIKFNDMSMVSANANKYKIFMTGTDSTGTKSERMASKPAGVFYVFGSTGYAGLYMVNKGGFKPQIIYMILRSQADMSGNLDDSTSGDSTDSDSDDDGEQNLNAGFKKYDQAQIFFNPGALGAKHMKALDGNGQPSAVDLYKDSVVIPEQQTYKKTLAADEKQLRLMQNSISEMKERLTGNPKDGTAGLGIQVPDSMVPKGLVGDKFVRGKGDDYIYQPAVVFPGGYQYDWRNGDLSQGKGWLKGLIEQTSKKLGKGTMSDDDYFDYVSKLGDSSDSDGADSLSSLTTANVDESQWLYADGSPVFDAADDSSDSSSSSSSSGDSDSTKSDNAQTATQNLLDAWNSYLSLKKQYQLTDMKNLLQLEDSVNVTNSATTINDSAKLLTVE